MQAKSKLLKVVCKLRVYNVFELTMLSFVASKIVCQQAVHSKASINSTPISAAVRTRIEAALYVAQTGHVAVEW
jgi:hypothetical protein